MKHAYATLSRVYLIHELLEGLEAHLRPAFRLLMDPDKLDELLPHKPSGFDHMDWPEKRTSAHLFVPKLGPLHISHKPQLDHRSWNRSYGRLAWPPASIPTSSLGMRIRFEEEDLLSEHRLKDPTLIETTETPAQTPLTREGDTDFLFGLDPTIWHLPVSVGAQRRIKIESVHGQTSELLSSLGAHVTASRYFHLYPYGALVGYLCVSIAADQNIGAGHLIQLLADLERRTNVAGLVFTVDGFGRHSAVDLLNRIADHIFKTLVVVPIDDPLRAWSTETYDLMQATLIAADVDAIDDKTLAGIMLADEQFRRFGGDFLATKASLYGKYSGDRVLANRSNLTVALSPAWFGPSGRRRFFWRLQQVVELARAEREVLHAIAWRMESAGRRGGPSDVELGRLLAIGEHLLHYHRGMPAHHRRWFYKYAATCGLDHAVQHYRRQLANLYAEMARRATVGELSAVPRVNINVSQSTIGTLNLGTIVGAIENHLTTLESGAGKDVSDGLRRVTEAILSSGDITDDKKKELVENVEFVAEEAVREPSKRRVGLVKAALTALSAGLAVASSAATVWTTLEPIVVQFFGIK